MRLLWPSRRARGWAVATSWFSLGCMLACLSLWSSSGNFDCDTEQRLPVAEYVQVLRVHDLSGGVGVGSNVTWPLETARHAADLQESNDRDAGFRLSQTLVGALLMPASPVAAAMDSAAPSARNWSGPEVVAHNVTLMLVKAFSPRVEEHARLMFEDKFGECQIHALGPAMAVWRGQVVACVRIFQPQYVLARVRPRPAPLDTWQENYVYTMRLRPSDYEPLEAGRMLGIPTPTNGRFPYKKDGPLDPRAFMYKGRLYLLYYSYGMPTRNTTSYCRMYFWDYERSVKRVISLTGLHLQKADINWSPLVISGSTLYLIYTFDPLRVLLCDPDTGSCALHYAQPGADRYPFDGSSDALRGGTPFIEYAHPYYISVAHSSARQSPRTKPTYAAHVAIVRVDTWRLVYVSGPVSAEERWLRHVPLVLSDYVAAPFWYPTSIIPRSDGDAYDIGCHLNDHSSYILRLTGLGQLLADVVQRDISSSVGDGGGFLQMPPPRAAQQFVLNDFRRRVELAASSQPTLSTQPPKQPPPTQQPPKQPPTSQPTTPTQPPKQSFPKQPTPTQQPPELSPPTQTPSKAPLPTQPPLTQPSQKQQQQPTQPSLKQLSQVQPSAQPPPTQPWLKQPSPMQPSAQPPPTQPSLKQQQPTQQSLKQLSPVQPSALPLPTQPPPKQPPSTTPLALPAPMQPLVKQPSRT